MIAQIINFNVLFCRVFALFLALAAVTSAANADVYRWVEPDGTVNYGERAPEGLEFTVVSRSAPVKAGSRIINNSKARAQPTPNVAPRTAGGNPLPADNDMSDQQKEMLSEIQAAEAARVAAINKLREENCATSKRALANLQATGRIRVRDENGEQTIMSEEERIENINNAHKSIVTNCDSLG